jgi:hypothetical protein
MRDCGKMEYGAGAMLVEEGVDLNGILKIESHTPGPFGMQGVCMIGRKDVRAAYKPACEHPPKRTTGSGNEDN